jgi:putative transposase
VVGERKAAREGDGFSCESKPHHEELRRDTTVDRVNPVWSTDITYIRMARGFLCLVAVMDWFSRFVLSWSLSLTMEVEFCVEALPRALQRGRPEIFNGDQGSQWQRQLPMPLGSSPLSPLNA